MYLHPNDYLWMADQDRERAMAQRALERGEERGEVHSSTFGAASAASSGSSDGQPPQPRTSGSATTARPLR